MSCEEKRFSFTHTHTHTHTHSAHRPNTSSGMVFSLLKSYYSHSSNKVNYSTEVNRLFNDLLDRGHNKNIFFDIFEEVELKLIEINKRINNNKIMTCES